MRTKVTQTNFTGGEMSETLAGRVEIEQYYKSCSKARNVIIMPHGGLKRRGGLRKISGSYINKYCRLEAFTFSVTQTFLIVIATDLIHIYKDGAQVATVTSPYNTVAKINELDFVQSADTIIMVHEDVPPKKLVRGATDASWTISDITFTNVPTYDFGSGAEAVWSATRGYPRTVTFHSGRLWLGGTKQRVSSVFGSKSNEFFNFDVGTGLADEAIFDTLDTDQYNKIQGIFSGRALQVFTSGGEFFNSAQLITPEDSVWLQQTNYGSKRIRPITIDGATLFVGRNGRSLRQFLFNFNEDAYSSINMLLLAEHLATDIFTMDAQRGTLDNISDFVYLIDSSGKCLVLNTMRSENILGWTQWDTQGSFIDVAVVGDIVYFLVLRDGSYYIEQLDNATYTDHCTTVSNVTPFTTVSTSEAGSVLTKEHKVICDGSIQANKTPNGSGVITLDRSANYAEVGLNYDIEIKSMPINFRQGDGYTANSRQRVLRTALRVYNTKGAFVQDQRLKDKKFPIVFNQQDDPYTGVLETRHLGYERVFYVTVTQQDPLPFHLLQLEAETEAE